MILSNFSDLKIQSIKKFDHLIIAGATKTDSIDIERINGFNLRRFFIDSIMIDQSVICDDQLTFNQLFSESILIDSNENFKFIDQIFIDSLFSVVINGDAIFDDVIDLNLLNLIEINNLMELTVSNYFGGAIGGLKIFQRDLTINDLIVHHVRNIDLNHVFKNILRRSKSQEIPAKWSFNQIDCFSLKSLIVDGINKNLLIEKTDVLEIFNHLMIDYLSVESMTKGDLINLDLGITAGHKWRNVTVLGTRNMIKSTIFDKLIKKSVLINENQVIGENVYFKKTVLFNRINNLINDFDLLIIFNDSLKKTGSQQIINGNFIFNQWKIDQLISIDYNQISLINDLNPVLVNQTIFRLKINDHNIVSGKKQFLANPMINQLKTDYLINKINVKNLIFSYNNEKLINFGIKKIKIKQNLRVREINQINLIDFLNKRINKINKNVINTKLFFEKLILININIDSINNLKINDLIELKSNQIQRINKKLQINQLIINNDLIINHLNDKNFIDWFNQSIFITNNLKMKKLSLKSMILNQGFYQTNPWRFNQQKINKINKSLIPINKKESIFSFIDYASDVEIIYNQELYESNQTIYVNRVFPSNECGFCECPAQLRVTPLPTYKIIINQMKFFKRFFDLSTIKISTHFQSNCNQINQTEIIINKKINKINDLITDVKQMNNILIISWMTSSTTVYQINDQSLTKVQEFTEFPNESIIELINNQEILIISNRFVRQTNIYKFNGKFFKKTQEITGFYNLISGVTTSDVMLIISQIGSMKIQVFKLNQEIFQLYQDISFESKIKTLTALTTGSSILIGIALNDGYLSIYCYNYLQGWKLSTIGYFNWIESLVPLRIHQRDFILILQSNTTSIVSVNYV